MQELSTKTIREIALEFPLTTRIFEEYKIDYCCGGRKPFAEACLNAGVAPEVILQKIERALDVFGDSLEFTYVEKERASDLIDYILEKHHVFTKTELVRLTELMEKVYRRHGEHHPELAELKETFQLLEEDLTVHMRKEEMVLFPYIKTLEASIERNLAVPLPHFGTVRNPVRMMMQEHDTAGDLLRKMRGTSNDYSLPAGACPTYTALYSGFEDLERDLHQHIHLENNILFPQAVKLEETANEKESIEDSDFNCSDFAVKP